MGAEELSIYTSTEEKFNYYKSHEMKLVDKKLEYKDPVGAAFLSLIIPAGGLFYLEYYDTAIIYLVGELLAAGVLGYLTAPGEKTVGDIAWAAFGMRTLWGILVEPWILGFMTDDYNQEYYKQLLCPNSPYQLKKTDKIDNREPWIAFLLATFTAPGVGNMYAGNIPRGIIFMSGGLLGGGMVLLANPLKELFDKWDLDVTLIRFGIVLSSFMKLLDMVTAPGYAAENNDLRRVSQNDKIQFYPGIIDDKLGLCLNYSF